MLATDIDAQEMVITLGGQDWTLRFDNTTILKTEVCYAQATGVRMGYLGILTQAEQRLFSALCPLCYGAVASAEIAAGVPPRERTPFKRFDAACGYLELMEQAEDVVDAAMRALYAGKSGAQKKA